MSSSLIMSVGAAFFVFSALLLRLSSYRLGQTGCLLCSKGSMYLAQLLALGLIANALTANALQSSILE